ncbi:urea amidolyase associated protein UAAP1 [Rubritalea marina]|uniref:urea amidolyase associated protein UAAP1 n=1 Tax=Rubritalea marina TaxID=361055 RepID=UPI000376BDE7|nr:urea amidolyase associated protein UAAP1 [Rubritalea marina]
MNSQAIYQWELQASSMWSQRIKRGKSLRLTDLEGGANVSMLLYNADHPLERYNMPDTLKGQHIFYLQHPYCLHSDMGRIFASITKDSVGWHDTVSGCTNAALIENKYGSRTFQDARNDFFRNGQETFLIELSKWGLGLRDIVPNLNFFSKVAPNELGDLQYVDGHSQAGDHVELRFEMDTLVVLNNCPHPLDPSPEYCSKKVLLEVFDAPTVQQQDPCINSRPENVRAFLHTANYYLLNS